MTICSCVAYMSCVLVASRLLQCMLRYSIGQHMCLSERMAFNLTLCYAWSSQTSCLLVLLLHDSCFCHFFVVLFLMSVQGTRFVCTCFSSVMTCVCFSCTNKVDIHQNFALLIISHVCKIDKMTTISCKSRISRFSFIFYATYLQ